MTEENHIENIRAIAELQTQVANVASDVSTVIRQLEQLWQLQNQVARLQQEQSDHRDTIKRLAGRVEDGERAGILLKESTEKWVNRGIGAVFVGGLLSGFIQWMVLDRVGNYESNQRSNTENITTLDRRMSWAEYELKIKAKKDQQP
jgi:hypothetical protein